MAPADPPLADLWPLLVIGVLILVAWGRDIVRARRERRAAARGPYLIFPVEGRGQGPRIVPMPIEQHPAAPAETPVGAAPAPAAPAPAAAPVRAAALDVPPAPPAEATLARRGDSTLEGTVQLLPGWLEVVRGTTSGHEIRFVRVGAEEVPEITLGRSEGPEYRHIRIAENTVSRLHARMSFQDRMWRIANLSQTNPVRVNGRLLFRVDESAVLGDGDRIQLGEVELRFREGRQ